MTDFTLVNDTPHTYELSTAYRLPASGEVVIPERVYSDSGGGAGGIMGSLARQVDSLVDRGLAHFDGDSAPEGYPASGVGRPAPAKDAWYSIAFNSDPSGAGIVPWAQGKFAPGTRLTYRDSEGFRTSAFSPLQSFPDGLSSPIVSGVSMGVADMPTDVPDEFDLAGTLLVTNADGSQSWVGKFAVNDPVGEDGTLFGFSMAPINGDGEGERLAGSSLVWQAGLLYQEAPGHFMAAFYVQGGWD